MVLDWKSGREEAINSGIEVSDRKGMCDNYCSGIYAGKPCRAYRVRRRQIGSFNHFKMQAF